VQGWRRENIYPDFIFATQRADGSTRIAVVETKGDHLAGNVDSAYKRDVLDLLSRNFAWETTVPIGTLELVQPGNETVECALVLLSEWPTKLPAFLATG